MVLSVPTTELVAQHLDIPFVVLQNISWQTYQALLTDLGENRSVRLAYAGGILEIEMPSKLHELINRLLERIITTLTEELGLNVLPLGSTTFNRENAEQSVEPDSCFYIQNASRINIADSKLPEDIPPDLVVEVDITSSSRSRLKIYQALGVPEIWCYTRQGFAMLHMHNGEYIPSSHSLAFPTVSVELIAELLEKGKQSQNQNSIIRELRSRLERQNNTL